MALSLLRNCHLRLLLGHQQFRRSSHHNWRVVASYKMNCESSGRHSNPRRQFTVAIEGNIGSGKTTLLQYFEQFKEVQVLQEPIEFWRNVKGHNLLDLMYKDSTRWSLTFQTYVQLTMVKAHTEKQKCPVKMIERSLYSAKYCFVENLYRGGSMPSAEFVVLTEWFDWLTKNLEMGLDLIVYLRTSPEVVYDRIRKRSRVEERCVPIEYLKQLHQLHEDWLVKNTFPVPAPVLILDGNLVQEEVYHLYEKHLDEILFRSRVSSIHPPLRNDANEEMISPGVYRDPEPTLV